MARIRTIKPEFWVDDVMVELPIEARLLFIGMWNFVDDEGYIEDKPKRIKMQIFPADNILIEDSLSALCDSGRLHAFDSDQGPLLRVANWERHQRINRKSETRFTGITPRNRTSSVITHAHFSEHSLPEGKRKGREKEGKGKEGKKLTHDSQETHDCNAREFSPEEIDAAGEILADVLGEPMDALTASVAVELITEASTEPVQDLRAYITAAADKSYDRVLGLCQEAVRQIKHMKEGS